MYIMKKYIYMIAAAALAFAGCAKEVAKVDDAPKADGKTMTFKVSVEDPIMDAETKATLGRDGVFAWKNEDQVAFINSSGSIAAAGTISGDEVTVNSGDYVYAIYPMSAHNGLQKIAYNNQTGPIVVAQVTAGKDLTFYHIASLVNIKVSGVTVDSSIEFAASGASSCGANFSFDTDGVPTLSGSDFTYPLITTGKYTPEQLANGVSITVPNVSYPGFKIGLRTESKVVYYEKETTKTFDLSTRGKLLNMKEFAVPTYTVVGEAWRNIDSTTGTDVTTDTFTTAWDLNQKANNMMPCGNGIYKISYSNAPEKLIFKIVKNHSYDESWPTENYEYEVHDINGTVTIVFDSNNNSITVEDADAYVIAGPAVVFGSEWGKRDQNNRMSEKYNDVTLYKSYTKVSGEISFKVVKNNSSWYPSANYVHTVPSEGDLTVVFYTDSNTPYAFDSASTYTIAGSAGMFGTEWDETDNNNQMTFSADYTYSKTYPNVPAGSYVFKIVRNKDWDEGSWPASNYSLTVTEEKDITIKINVMTQQVTVE